MTNVISIGNSARGFTRMDNELYEALISADLSGRELRVALAVHRLTAGYNVETARIPAATIAQMANLRREHVSRMISELIRQRVLYRAGGSKGPLGISPVSEWRIDPKNEDKKGRSKTAQSAISGTSLVPFPAHIKDRKDIQAPTVLVDAERQPEQAAAMSEPARASAKPTVQACPHQAIVDLYHEILPELPRVALLSDTRRRHLQSRWREHAAHQSLDFWRDYFLTVKASQFLMGRVPGRMGAKPFRATFDWLIAPSNFVKVVEGNYA